MDKKSKILIITLFILVAASAIISYYNYIVVKNYEVINASF